MGKESQIKISNEFKFFLRREKQEGEDFEGVIKRLISVPKPSTPQEKQSKNQYTKQINIPKTETIEEKTHKNMSDFNLEVQEKGLQNAPIKIKEIKSNIQVKHSS